MLPSIIVLEYLGFVAYSSYGYSNVSNSHNTIPKLKTSEEISYSPPSSKITSGANHCQVLKLPEIPEVIALDKPKSATFAQIGAFSSSEANYKYKIKKIVNTLIEL